ncbi:MAG: hypothetical protein KC912_20005 [Proteobacteria bacterium]|nr:hypothetical protein [Pseudomonadota bacterium]
MRLSPIVLALAIPLLLAPTRRQGLDPIGNYNVIAESSFELKAALELTDADLEAHRSPQGVWIEFEAGDADLPVWIGLASTRKGVVMAQPGYEAELIHTERVTHMIPIWIGDTTRGIALVEADGYAFIAPLPYIGETEKNLSYIGETEKNLSYIGETEENLGK